MIANDVYQGTEAECKLSIVINAQTIVSALDFAAGGVVAEFICWRRSMGIILMGGGMLHGFDWTGIGMMNCGLFSAMA